MSIKTIVVVADNTAGGLARMNYASRLSVAHDAFLVGLLPVSRSGMTSSASAFSLGHAANADVIHHQSDRERKLVEEVEAKFDSLTNQAGVSHELRVIYTDSDDNGIQLASLHADLVVAPVQSGEVAPRDYRPDSVQFATGVPFLLIPNAWSSIAVPQSILVGWNGSREARRAVHDALPILLRARSVTVAIVDPQSNLPQQQEPGSDLAMYLLRHGVKLIVQPLQANGSSVADVLLDYAEDNAHDLIIVGAYSHSRTLERMFGGVTRSLISYSTVPLLISH